MTELPKHGPVDNSKDSLVSETATAAAVADSTIFRDYVLSQQRTKAAQSAPSVTDLAGEVIYSGIYSGAQSPAIGLAQLADRGLKTTSLAKTVDYLPAPQADFGTARWHAQQFGGALGMIVPFAITRGGMKMGGLSLVARTEATAANTGRLFTTLKAASVVDAAATGYAYDFLMTPVAEGEKDFWGKRREHGATGALTFATLEAGSTVLRHATRTLAPELKGMKKIGHDVITGALPGIPAGIVNADASSYLSSGKFATMEERIKGAYTMSIVGGGLSGMRLLHGQESAAKENAYLGSGKPNLEQALTQRSVRAQQEVSRLQERAPEGKTDGAAPRRFGSQSRNLVNEGSLAVGRAMAGGDIVAPNGVRDQKLLDGIRGNSKVEPNGVRDKSLLDKIRDKGGKGDRVEPGPGPLGPKGDVLPPKRVDPNGDVLNPKGDNPPGRPGDGRNPFARKPPNAVAPTKSITTQHLEEFQALVNKPFESGSALEQMNAWNNASLQADGFIRNHRSLFLEDAIKVWAKEQPRPEIQKFVEWAYEGPRSQARRSNYLMDLAMAEGRAQLEQARNEGKPLDQAMFQWQQLGSARGNFFKEAGLRNLTEAQQNSTIETLLRLMETGQDPRRSTEIVPGNLEKKAALQMLLQAGEPSRIVQYHHPTCAVASLEVDMFTRNPDVATAAVSEVLRTGKFTTSDGTVIKVDAASLRAERGSNEYGHTQYRSYASEVFQTLAQNVYWQRSTQAPDGRIVPAGSLSYILRQQPNGDTQGFVVDKSGPGMPRTFPAQGYNSMQIRDMGQQIGGPKTEPRYVPQFNSIQDMTNYMTQLRGSEHFPRIIVIDARHLLPHIPKSQGPAWHAVTVTGAYNLMGNASKPVDTVNWHNTWEGRTYPRSISIKQLFDMTHEKLD
jgi:hypothetical protein